MTEKLYTEDSYRFEFKAVILQIIRSEKGLGIILDRTCFYPDGGGQEHDTGFINDAQVFDVQYDDSGVKENIVHYVKEGSFSESMEIKGRIDRDRRMANMRKHTGQHILSRAFVNNFSVDTVSAHLGETESTIELNRADLTTEQLQIAETLANGIIRDNREVSSHYYNQAELRTLDLRKLPDREGIFRIVKIKDFDTNACGGTHLKQTGEVGLLKIIGQEKIRGHLRITFLAGAQAFDDYYKKNRVVSELAQTMTCHYKDLPSVYEKLSEQNSALRREINNLNNQLIPQEIDRLIDQSEKNETLRFIAEKYENKDVKYLKKIMHEIVDNHDALVLLLADQTVMLASSKKLPLNCGDIIKQVIIEFGGKGGGNNYMAQAGSIDNIEFGKLKIFVKELVGIN